MLFNQNAPKAHRVFQLSAFLLCHVFDGGY